MVQKNKYSIIVVSIMGMVFAVAASCCHGEPPPSWSVKAVYTRVMASSKAGSDYDLNRDLFMQQLPGGEPVRLTDWAKHPLLAPYVGGPHWSPNGEHVLFMGSLKGHTVIMPQNDWPSYPWILDIQTKKLKLIGPTKDRWYMNVAWLPNQNEILARVVLGKRPQFYYYGDLQSDEVMSGGEARLVTINIKTGREKTIIRKLNPGRFFVFANDHKLIIYERYNDKLTLYNLARGKWRTLLRSAPLDVAAISPDGKRFAYYNKGVLRVCNIQTSKVQVLYNARDVYDRGGKLIWSPNGKWIVLRHSSGDITSIDPPVASSTSYLTLVDATSGKARLLLEDSRDFPVGWTRDSMNIILRHEEKTDDAFPNDTKTVLTAYPISAQGQASSVEIVGYQGGIDIAKP